MEAGHELWQAARRGDIKRFMELVSCERVADAVDPIGGRTAIWLLLLTALPRRRPAAPGHRSSILIFNFMDPPAGDVLVIFGRIVTHSITFLCFLFLFNFPHLSRFT